MLSFKRGILSLRGRPIARVEAIGDDIATPYIIDNAMKRATKLYNNALPRPKPHYFRPETRPETRYLHAGLAFIAAFLFGSAIYTGSLPGFVAFGVLALAVYWIMPER